jgi:predicted aldo/keto reductase-like oxidoreductase
MRADIAIAEEFSVLSEEEQQQFTKSEVILGDSYCRECGYCLPCPEEMDIPAILRMERTCTVYGLKEWIREEVARLKINTEVCPACGICEERCPYNLPVREMVSVASRFIGTHERR